MAQPRPRTRGAETGCLSIGDHVRNEATLNIFGNVEEDILINFIEFSLGHLEVQSIFMQCLDSAVKNMIDIVQFKLRHKPELKCNQFLHDFLLIFSMQ